MKSKHLDRKERAFILNRSATNNFLHTYIHICLLVLEKLTDLQLVKKFPVFHGTRRFITAITSVRHLSLSWASPIQSIYPHPTSWRSFLILYTHLRLVLPSGLFHSGFATKTLYTGYYMRRLLTYLLTYSLHGAESFLSS